MKDCLNTYMKVGIVQFMAFPDAGLDGIKKLQKPALTGAGFTWVFRKRSVNSVLLTKSISE